LLNLALHAEQTRRLMALTAIADDKNRTQATAVQLMDQRTLRDWVIRFDERSLRRSDQ